MCRYCGIRKRMNQFGSLCEWCWTHVKVIDLFKAGL